MRVAASAGAGGYRGADDPVQKYADFPINADPKQGVNRAQSALDLLPESADVSLLSILWSSTHIRIYDLRAKPGSSNVPDGTETFVFDVTGLNGAPTVSDVRAFQGQGCLAISTGVDIGPGASVPEPSSGMLGLWGVIALAGVSLFRKFVA